MKQFLGPCPACGGIEFAQSDVLWPELINAWQLSVHEVAYVNRQQGFHCKECYNNLRAMGLAAAVTNEYGFRGTLDKFCKTSGDISILEINTAGELTRYFKNSNQHKLAEYPAYDMEDLSFESESYQLIVHSDTLEHVPNPERALSECQRVLAKNGICIFTVPIIVNRMTRSRAGLPFSFHGRSGVPANDQIVFSEFGADFWQIVLKAGFSSCKIFSLEYPTSIAIVARN